MTPRSHRPWDDPLRLFFWLAFGITWGAGGIGLLVGAFNNEAAPPHLHPLHYLAAFGPSIAGFVMALQTDGLSGLRALLVRVIPRPRNVPWYLAAVVGFLAANFLIVPLFAPSAMPPVQRLLPVLGTTLLLDTGPLGEEFGWRGFALPRLLNVRSPLAAAIVLGAIWFAWHLPTFFITTLSQHQLSIPLFFVNSVALSVIMTWLYLRSDGDLLLMLLVHAMANYCGALGVPFPAEVAAEVMLAAAIVVSGGLHSSLTPIFSACANSPSSSRSRH